MVKNDDMQIDIESVKITSLDKELKKPKKGVARFWVEVNPPVTIARRVLIYSDGRVYLDD